MLWDSNDIAHATQGTCSGHWAANGVSIDSRSVNAGDLFIALQGPQFDGHDYIQSALAKGAAGAIAARVPDGVDASRLVRVDDTFKALERLGHAARARSTARIMAVTGSVGKTGCKEALRQVLSAQQPSYANMGSFNNHWGVPLSLARMPQESRYGVFEIGMNHVGELGPLSRMVKPQVALITTIAAVHIANFSGLDEIADAKSEILEGLVPQGHAVLNADNAYIGFLSEKARSFGARIVSFGKSGTDAKLEGFTLHADGSTVTAHILGKRYQYKVGLPGEHWVMNSLAVLLTAGVAGADVAHATETLGHLQAAQGRGGTHEVRIADGSFTVIDESYNASPVAVEMAIKVLAGKQPPGRRMLALADMRELGVHARDAHLALKPVIEAASIDTVFCCGELMKHLYDALPPHLRGGYEFTAAALAPKVAAAMQPGDMITIKGSHSMMMEKVVAALLTMHTSQPNTQLAG